MRSPLLWPDSHQLKYSFRSVVSHIRLARLPGCEDPRPLIFLAAVPTPCHPIVPRRPSARSTADGRSAPVHLTSSATRGRGAFIPWDLTGRCGSNSLHSCLHASNPKPLGTRWTTCSAFSLQVRASTQYACAESRLSAFVIAVSSAMIGTFRSCSGQ